MGWYGSHVYFVRDGFGGSGLGGGREYFREAVDHGSEVENSEGNCWVVCWAMLFSYLEKLVASGCLCGIFGPRCALCRQKLRWTG